MQHSIGNAAPSVKVRYRDLSVKDEDFREQLVKTFERLLSHGQLIMGREVEIFEETFAKLCGAQHAVGVASGTSAIYLALRALGVGPGDEVITTPMSWVATLNAIVATGATPVFADIRNDLNIDPAAVSKQMTARTKAIVPVHYTGRLCDMDAINTIAKSAGVLVIEDAAQAVGAGYADGRRAGNLGDAAAFSLNPMKILAGFGDAGVVVTNSAAAVEKIKAYRYLGTVNQEVCIAPELNHKIDSLQAALLCDSIPRLDAMIDARRRIAQLYNERLAACITVPSIPVCKYEALFFDYTVLSEQRDELARYLGDRGIECKIRHPFLMCDQPAYKHLVPGELPVARWAVQRILSLPCHEKLTEREIDYVSEAVQDFHK